MYLSKITLSSPNDFNDSLLADSRDSKKSYYLWTILMPLPPPPITALIIMGYYIISAYINFRIFINFIFDKKKFNINL